jgi:hypothetical protein
MVKTGIKTKKIKRRTKLIKDKAIVNFLLDHMKPAKIKFPKLRIPSYLNLENKENNEVETNPKDDNQNFDKVFSVAPLLNFFLEEEKN